MTNNDTMITRFVPSDVRIGAGTLCLLGSFIIGAFAGAEMEQLRNPRPVTPKVEDSITIHDSSLGRLRLMDTNGDGSYNMMARWSVDSLAGSYGQSRAPEPQMLYVESGLARSPSMPVMHVGEGSLDDLAQEYHVPRPRQELFHLDPTTLPSYSGMFTYFE